MNLQNNKQSGFTIVELLIVIVVIAILAAISVVTFTGIQQRGRDTQRSGNAANITKALSACTADAVAWTELDDEGEIKAALGAGGACKSVTNIDKATIDLIGTTAPEHNSKIMLKYDKCETSGSPTGAKFTYWSEAENAEKSVTAGTCA